MERGRGYAHIARVYRKQKNLAEVARAAKLALKESKIQSQRIRTHLKIESELPARPLSPRAGFEGKGIREEARANYRKFLEIWKNADADIPEVIVAKKSVDNL